MRADQSIFQPGWGGTSLERAGLGALRPDRGTYGIYDYAKLPPLPVALDGAFGWLADAPEHAEWPIGGETEEGAAALAAKAAQLLAAETALPSAFVTFVTRPELHRKIRSMTACFLDICPVAVPAPEGGGRLIRFLTDSQYCAFWYLYLTPDGRDHAVLLSGAFFGAPGEGVDDEDDEPRDPKLFFAAESFEEYMCRTWLENEIGFAFAFDDEHDKAALPAAAAAYLEAYRATAADGPR